MRIPALLGLFLIVSAPATAGMRCTTDILGNQVCTGTGEDSGYQVRGTTDILGNDTWTDNQGNTTRCTTDILGNYVCN